MYDLRVPNRGVAEVARDRKGVKTTTTSHSIRHQLIIKPQETIKMKSRYSNPSKVRVLHERVYVPKKPNYYFAVTCRATVLLGFPGPTLTQTRVRTYLETNRIHKLRGGLGRILNRSSTFLSSTPSLFH